MTWSALQVKGEARALGNLVDMVTATRPATASDIDAVAQLLARAFDDDPVMMWLWPDSVARSRGLPIMFSAITKYQHLKSGGCEVAVDGSGVIAGAALWDPPGRWQTSTATDWRMMPAMIRAFRSRIRTGGRFADIMKEHHPAEPHWYLGTIGTNPDARGAGHGQTLMRSRLDRCDEEHAPAYLESSKVDNIGYYERFGFEVTGEIKLPDGGPIVYPMWRKAT